MQTYDTHAHLDHLEDLSSALDNARREGIIGIVAMSMDLESCRRCLEIKKSISDPHIYLGMGMHPCDANPDDVAACIELAEQNKEYLSVIGEIGLDFWYKWVRKDQQKKDEQREVYRQFLDLARRLDLPAVIHSRGCWRECFETARAAGIKKAEFHWYSGPVDVLKDIVAEGYFVSAPPCLAYAEDVRRAIAQAPLDQILIETDCPVSFKDAQTGERFTSEPKDVLRTLNAFCELRGLSPEEGVKVVNTNAQTFLGIKSEVS